MGIGLFNVRKDSYSSLKQKREIIRKFGEMGEIVDQDGKYMINVSQQYIDEGHPTL